MKNLADDILDTFPAILFHIDDMGNVLDFRPSKFIQNHPRPKKPPCSLSEVLPEETAAEIIRLSEAATENKAPTHFCYNLSNEEKQSHFEGRLSKYDNITTVVVWDASEKTKADEEKHHIYEQLRKNQKMEALGQLTGGIAHDFNNILASILGYADLTLDAVDSMGETELVRYLQEVIDSGEKARDLIAQMLAFARAKPSDAITLMLNPLIKETIKMLQSALPSTIELDIKAEEELPLVKVDPTELHQAIVNLCINSRDAIGQKGTIDIGATHTQCDNFICASCQKPFTGSFAEISIADSGKGINPVLLDKIFDPFFSTKKSANSTGTGLSVVHEIIHDCKGHIMVESQPDYGTTFRLFLPIVEEKEKATSRTQKSISFKNVDIDSSILVVDDEESVARLQGELLRLKGFSAVVFSDALHALEAFKVDPNRFDLVLVDQTMPGLTGIELATEILGVRPDMPIVLNTAQGDHDYTEEAKEAGIRAFLTKPIPSETLIRTIADLLGLT
ncbi:response regulator [Pseudomonadota bacterium]